MSTILDELDEVLDADELNRLKIGPPVERIAVREFDDHDGDPSLKVTVYLAVPLSDPRWKKFHALDAELRKRVSAKSELWPYIDFFTKEEPQ